MRSPITISEGRSSAGRLPSAWESPMLRPVADPVIIPNFPIAMDGGVAEEYNVRTRTWRSRELVALQLATGAWFQSNVARFTDPLPTSFSASKGVLPSDSHASASASRAPVATSAVGSLSSAPIQLRGVVPPLRIGKNGAGARAGV